MLALAFALAGGVFAAYGTGPLEAYGTLLEGTLGATFLLMPPW